MLIPKDLAASSELWALFIRLFVGSILITASLAKLLSPSTFTRSLENYKVVPQSLIKLIAPTVIGLELTIGTLLVVDRSPASAVAGGLLFVLFAAFTARALAANKSASIECGCIGSVAKLRVGRMYVLATVVLGCVLAASSVVETEVPLHSVESIMVGAVAVLAAAAYWLLVYAISVLRVAQGSRFMAIR